MYKYIALLGAAFGFSLVSFAQTENVTLPYAYDHYQKYNPQVYDKTQRFHSAIKPFYGDHASLENAVDSVSFTGDSLRRTWLGRKLFQQHLIEVNKDDYQIYADFLPDFTIGYDQDLDRSTWLNTRGYQIGV